MAYFFVVLLLTLLGTLLSVPLLPAFNELRYKQDAEPLNVIQQHAGDIRHFAQSFASLIEGLQAVLDRSQQCGDVARGVLPDGSHYVVLRNTDELPVQKEGLFSICRQVIAFSSKTACPGRINFTKELYARGEFSGGDENQYRAILGANDVRLGKLSTVLRWAHSGGELVADGGCNLYGRISAEKRVALGRG